MHNIQADLYIQGYVVFEKECSMMICVVQYVVLILTRVVCHVSRFGPH
jgi:hypothetical protein